MKFIICPGSAENQKFKRWPILKYLELAELYEINQHTVTIVLGPEEHYLSNFFLKFNVVISASFDELKQISYNANLIVCNDSFLLHYFSIINCNVLAIYGPTDPDRTLPPNAFKIISKKTSLYRPCWGKTYYGRCENGRCSCFDGLDVQDVYKKSLNILSI